MKFSVHKDLSVGMKINRYYIIESDKERSMKLAVPCSVPNEVNLTSTVMEMAIGSFNWPIHFYMFPKKFITAIGCIVRSE